jgi:nitrite reductase/ring-hydroxylating ferredoxin subunit
MTYTRVLSTADLAPGQMRGIEVNEEEMLLVNLEGEYYALGNICTHMTCRLSGGSIKGHNVICPCHFSVFEVKTGRVLGGPANRPEPTFKVKVEKENVLVDL